MPSPFPGMDPWVEEPDLWRDVHVSMLSEMRAHLNEVMPNHYRAAADRQVWIHEPDAKTRRSLRAPDTYVIERMSNAEQNDSAPVKVAPPQRVTLPVVREEGHRFLKIIDRRKKQIVTVIELLSPSNKATGPKREQYLIKRNEYFAANVNLVEIDLLRGGPRLPLDEHAMETDYYVLVCRPNEIPSAGMWAFGVRDELPVIPIPLSEDDSDVELPLRLCFDRVYDKGRYDDDFYDHPPVPRLRKADAAWARKILASHRKRSD